jgi:hypothetical protein
MANLAQYPIAKPTACPYHDCDGVEFKDLAGASEAAFTEELDSNNVSIGFRCKKCLRTFCFRYKFEIDENLNLMIEST